MSTSNNGADQNMKLQGAYTKGQIYGSSLPAYRLQSPKRKRRNSSCCLCGCLCLLVLLVALVLLAGISGFVFWVIYRPKLPKISVTSVQIPVFNVTKNSRLNCEFILKLNATNPNKKISFIYDDFPVKVYSGDVDIAEGSIPGFFNEKKNSTVVMADLKGQNITLDGSDARALKSAASEGKITLDVQVRTRVGVKIEKWKSPKVRVEVNCNGVSVRISRTKAASGSSADLNSKCKFKVRIKVFRWYL